MIHASTCRAILIALLFMPAGAEVCAQQKVTDSELNRTHLQKPTTPVTDYLIGNGDILQISVWGEPQMDHSVTVRPDGKISLPLINDVTVTGLSVAETQVLLRDKLTQFLKRPQVSVLVSEVHSKLIYVTGEVQHPGAYALTSPTNVIQLVTRAGGVTDFAKSKRAYVLRQPDGQRLPVNLKAVLQGHHTEQNIELSSGDTVVVP